MKMKPLYRIIGIFVLLLFWGGAMRSYAQELNATVTINTQQIDASLRPRFETLKQSLEEFINGQQWTGAQFSTVEKITCTFTLTINEVVQSDVYKVSITVQARRPVYNSTYQTILINWRDDLVTLPYQEGENLTYNEFNLDNELIATIAYYAYLVLGLDFDSFSSMGGEQYLRKCESIVSQMQSSDSNGWKAFDSKTNRHALITALLDPNQQPFRELWYTYHRQGLDQMAQSVDKGRSQISASFEQLATVSRCYDPASLPFHQRQARRTRQHLQRGSYVREEIHSRQAHRPLPHLLSSTRSHQGRI